jgi:hypothetical protein
MMTSKHQIASEISEFLAEAADARDLAAMFDGGPAVADLLGYAAKLETEAAQLEEKLRHRFAVDLHDPKQILARCGERAEKLRALAEAMHDVKSRDIFLRLADDYDRMARPRHAAASSGRKRAG